MVRAYALAAVLLAVIGIVAQLHADGKTIDLFYGDIYFVLAPLHVGFAGGLLFGAFAGVAMLFERLSGHKLGVALGYVHLGVTATSISVMVVAGLLLASYSTAPRPGGEIDLIWIVLFVACYAIFPAQLLFPINLVRSWWRGRHGPKSHAAFELVS
jgi:heme/copper-type cytochrome/quinol oxidase subunit 1